MIDRMYIGFFDSGLGGLIILRAVARALPQYDYYYYGDTAHLPYGDKSEAEIYQLSQVAMEYLFARDCALVIIACNTASAETLRRLQDEWLPAHYPNRRILGVIIPTIETLITASSQRAILLATNRTVSSGKYERELALRGDSTCALTVIATPRLVPLIEAGDITVALDLVWETVLPYLGGHDTIILGCTHYAELKDGLRARLEAREWRGVVLSQDEIIPQKLATYLGAHPEIAELLSENSTRTIHLTTHRPEYDRIAGQLLGGVFMGEE